MASRLWRAQETLASRLHGRSHMVLCPYCRSALRWIKREQKRERARRG